MKTAPDENCGFLEALKRKEADLSRVLRGRDGIAIEKSADPMDEIQYASERDLVIRNVDRESALRRQVKAALRRIDDVGFGTCIECDSAISSKRLAAVPMGVRGRNRLARRSHMLHRRADLRPACRSGDHR